MPMCPPVRRRQTDFGVMLKACGSGRVDVHNQFGTFISPRGSLLVHGMTWNSRLSIGSGYFAPTPLTEETEAAGLARLKIDRPLRAERGRSASWDVTRTAGPLTLTATLFRYGLTNPAVVERGEVPLTPRHSAGLIAMWEHADGRWTVDAWAPLDGRVINGGVRVTF